MLGVLKKLFGNKVNFAALVASGAVIVDVRSPQEFKSGHIAGAKNIPLDAIRSKTAEIKKWNKPVITVCRSGARSGMAKSMLKTAGVDVYNGGAWTSLQARLS